MESRSFKPSAPLNQRLEEQAKRLRKEARGVPPGVEHEKLIRQARQAETAAHIQEWVKSPGLQPPVMPEYRVYAVGDDGHFTGYEPLMCANDEEAIAKAKILSQRHGVEIWNGPRLVLSIPKQPARAITHEIHEGRMVPKPAR